MDQHRPRGPTRRRLLWVAAVVIAIAIGGAIVVAVNQETCDARAPTAYERQVICEAERSGGVPSCPPQLSKQECERAVGTVGGEHPGGPADPEPSGS